MQTKFAVTVRVRLHYWYGISVFGYRRRGLDLYSRRGGRLLVVNGWGGQAPVAPRPSEGE